MFQKGIPCAETKNKREAGFWKFLLRRLETLDIVVKNG